MANHDLELRIAWQQHIGESPTAMSWFDSVLANYRRPDRHYHDVRHVGWVVRHVITLTSGETVVAAAHRATDVGAVIAAAFFHDAVCDTRRSDNEAASAQLAHRALAELGWSPIRRQHVVSMIEATANHDIESADRETEVLLAADLAVLAAEPARYGDYVTAVRREYSAVTDDAWRIGRTDVLNRLLELDHLFAPSLQLATWESRARANIVSELASLSA